VTRAEALLPKNTPEEKIFYITFGVKYRHQEHPAGMKADGYAIIVADDEMAARRKAHEVFGQEYWSFIYDDLDRQYPERFDPESYPLGVLAVYYA
jgi:hypothetical protein